MHPIDFRVSVFAARSCEETRLHLCSSSVTSRPLLFLLLNEALSLVASDINKVADWLRTKFHPVQQNQFDRISKRRELSGPRLRRLLFQNKSDAMLYIAANCS